MPKDKHKVKQTKQEKLKKVVDINPKGLLKAVKKRQSKRMSIMKEINSVNGK